MKNFMFGGIVFSLFFVGCSKKETAEVYPVYSEKAPYDTLAKDSFSKGATSVAISRQIKMSTRGYQDSLKRTLKEQAEEKRNQAELLHKSKLK